MRKVLEEVVADDGARLAVVSDGPDDAPVTIVLAHGWTLTHRSWDAVVAHLVDGRQDVRVLRADQRDHGASRAPRGPATVPRLADDLAAVIRAHAPSGDVVLGGHSMGGMSVLALAHRHPDLVGERVRGVMLLSTSTGDLRRALPVTLAMRLLTLAPDTLPLPRIPAPLARHFGYGPRTPSSAVTGGRHGIRPTGARAVGSWFGALMSHDGRDALESLRDVPVTVMVGDHDRLTPPRHSALIAATLPSSRLVLVPAAGHMLPLEKPDVVARHLRELAEEPVARQR